MTSRLVHILSRRSAAAWLIVLAAALAYPISTVAGGGPRFPSPAECVHPATRDGQLEVVFGRFDSPAKAMAFRDQVVGYGFTGTALWPDGCGRIKVALRGVTSLEVGRQVIQEAHSVGLQPRLEPTVPLVG